MKKLLLSMLGVLMALPAMARDFKYTYEGQTLTYTVIDEDAKTVKTKEGYYMDGGNYSGNGVSGDLVLPSEVYDGDIKYTLTEIGYNAFCRTDLTSVTIPNSVTYIGWCAFSECSGMTSVTIPESVKSIADYAFQGCLSLTSVTIPDSVESIGTKAFYYCGLTSVIIPLSVTSIGADAFFECNMIKAASPLSGRNSMLSAVAAA